ncbi:hypothetical protein [Janthinobacterium fluminis]|uniref:Phasin protein n=1 Tax=Janthinobacterium fluminis TaxID=2987524 RepID=A0ABT5K307_9BURK|nr:hypothetical protein [Janthinobacterium fluminis]MDC8758666.1 hypothetical protein [Janthinobacterium fluminis]
MSTNTELPMHLYKANLELLQTTGKLIQESGQQFLSQAAPGDLQAFVSNVGNSQAAFVAGLGAAVQTWQKETTEALGGLAGAAPFGNAMGDFLKQFGK